MSAPVHAKVLHVSHDEAQSAAGRCHGLAHFKLAQVKAMCSLPSGGVPTTFLNSQQTKEQRSAVLKELNKVRQLCGSKHPYQLQEQVPASVLIKIRADLPMHLCLPSIGPSEACCNCITPAGLELWMMGRPEGTSQAWTSHGIK